MKTELRLKELLDWLQDEGLHAERQAEEAGNDSSLRLAAFSSAQLSWAAPLPGDASFRRYCRMEAPSGERLMLVDAPPPHESTQPFAGIAKAWREAGIAVPTIYAVNDADGFMALNLSPRESILEVLRPFWFTRTLTGVSIIAGFSCLALNMAMTARVSRAAHVDTEYAPYEGTEEKEAAVGTV